MGFEPSKLGLQFNAYLLSKVVKAHDFMPDLKVDRFMPVIIEFKNSSVLLTTNEITR